MMSTHKLLRLRMLTPFFAGLSALALTALPACKTEESARVDTTGPPPAGYETWDDYFEARDEMIKDQEQQMQRELGDDPMPHANGR